MRNQFRQNTHLAIRNNLARIKPTSTPINQQGDFNY